MDDIQKISNCRERMGRQNESEREVGLDIRKTKLVEIELGH